MFLLGFFSLSRLYIAKSIKRIQYFVELYVVVCHFLFNRIGILFYAIAIYSLKKSSKSHSNSNVLKVLYYVCILTTETGELLLGQSLEIQLLFRYCLLKTRCFFVFFDLAYKKD